MGPMDEGKRFFIQLWFMNVCHGWALQYFGDSIGLTFAPTLCREKLEVTEKLVKISTNPS